MICGRADAHRPLNAGPRRWQRGGGFGGVVSSPASCVERISIKWSKTDFSILYIRRMCCSLSGRWDAMASQRAGASAWSAEEPESGGSASACASGCRGTGQRTLVPTTRRMPDGAGRAAQ